MEELSFKAKEAIVKLIDDLALGEYDAIANSQRIGRLSKDELEKAVSDYGCRVISIPVDIGNAIDVYKMEGYRNRYSVDVALYTEEEGRSDLTLSLTLDDTEEEFFLVIDDMHVL